MSSLPRDNKVKFSFKSFLQSYVWLVPILVGIDVLTKLLAVKYLKVGESVEVKGLSWLVQLTLTYNTGAAFGMGSSVKIIQIAFCLISYLVGAFVIFYVVKNYKKITPFVRFMLMVILAGDIGNLIDRTFALLPLDTVYQYGVIDFVDITPLIKGFGIFNFADAVICVGIGLFILYILLDSFVKKEK